MNVLSEIVGDHKTLGSSRLYEDSLKIDELGSCIDLLQLFTRQLQSAFSQLSLCRRLGLELLLDYSGAISTISSESLSSLEVRVWLIVSNWLLHI